MTILNGFLTYESLTPILSTKLSQTQQGNEVDNVLRNKNCSKCKVSVSGTKNYRYVYVIVISLTGLGQIRTMTG